MKTDRISIKKSAVKPRAHVVATMRLHCKPGPHRDRKKEADRKACRSFRKRPRAVIAE